MQGIQHTVGSFCYQRASVNAHSSDRFRNPCGVAGKQFVVRFRAHKLDYTQFHHQLVDKFLCLFFRQKVSVKVTLNVDIQKGRGASEGHCRPVLVLYCSKVGKVQKLYRLVCVFGRLGNVVAVSLRHLFQGVEGFYLFGNLFTLLDGVHIHFIFKLRFVFFLLLNQKVHAVKRKSAVIADNSSPTVGIGQTRQNVSGAATSHFRRVGIEDRLIVRLAVLFENGSHVGVYFVAVFFQSLFGNSNPSKRLQPSFERHVCLQADYFFQISVYVTRFVRRYFGYYVRVGVQYASFLPFQFRKVANFLPQSKAVFRRSLQKTAVPRVRCVIFLYKISHVNAAVAPFARVESFPLLKHRYLFCCYSSIFFLPTQFLSLLACASLPVGSKCRVFGTFPPQAYDTEALPSFPHCEDCL